MATGATALLPVRARAEDAGSADSSNTSLRRARGGNLTTLDPHRPISAADMEIAADLFTGLTATDAAGRIVPGAAERWSVSSDGLRYEFDLRRDLRWSDGRALTAADCVASFRRMLAPATAALLGYRYDAIRNTHAVRTGRSAPDALGVSHSGATRVSFQLERPETDFLKLLAIAYLVPLHAIVAAGRDWAKPPAIVVSGAYRASSWAQNGTLVLERNPRFFDAARVAVARVDWVLGIDDATRLRLFRAGELDIAEITDGSQLALARRDLAARLRSVPFYGGGWIGLNVRREVFADARVRRALALATDRNALMSQVRRLGERPTESLVPDAVADYPVRASPEHAAWRMPQRIAAARDLLAAAGVSPVRPQTVRAIYSSNPLTQRTYLALNAMWSRLGIRVEPVGLESRAYNVALSQRDFDLMEYAPFSVVQSATSFIGRFRSDSFLNYSGYSNPEVDRLIDLAERQLDPALRAARYLDAERILLREYPVIPLFSGVAHRLVAARVRGWTRNPGLSLPSRYLSIG